jgi:hypothetical protein
MSYDNLSSVSQNVLKFYQQLTGEQRRIPFIFDDFHFCRSRVIGLDMTENRIFTLCRTITWVVEAKKTKINSTICVGHHHVQDWKKQKTQHNVLDTTIHMTENRIFTLCRTITWVVFLRMFWNFISSLPVKRGGSLSCLCTRLKKAKNTTQCLGHHYTQCR